MIPNETGPHPIKRPVYLKIVAYVALLLSGTGSLIAQSVMQRYISVETGGMNAFISYAISFIFIAALGAGTLAAGNLAVKNKRPIRYWILVEISLGILIPLCLPLFLTVHLASISWFGAYLTPIELYYIYVFLLTIVTSFWLAFLMGFNYPLAYQYLSQITLSSRVLPALILGFNTAGAALGSLISVRLMPEMSFTHIMWVAACFYMASGLLLLLLLTKPVISEPSADSQPPAFPVANPGYRKSLIMLFWSGFLGFAFEVAMFRHVSLLLPEAYWVFGIFLAVHLIFWAIGCVLPVFWRISVSTLWKFFAIALAVSGFYLVSWNSPSLDLPWTNYSRLFAAGIFFLPALISGMLFSQIHYELEELDGYSASRLYAINLAGVFLGGLTFGYVWPSVLELSYIYGFAIFALVVWALDLYLHKIRKESWIVLFALVITIGGMFFISPLPHKEYYLGLIWARNKEESKLSEISEDWTSAAWIYNGDFFVSGYRQTPNFIDPCGGWRFHQAMLPISLENNDRIYYIGVSIGVSNGALAALLPGSSIVNVDYSKSLEHFWREYPQYNFNLLNAPNATTKVQDGRLGLILEKERFDVIMEFANHEGRRGISNIKSMEFFALVKRRLSDDGTFIGLGHSENYVSTLQQFFQYTYRVQNLPIVIGSDSPIETKIRDVQGEGIDFSKIECFAQHFASGKAPTLIYPLKPIKATLVTDLYPISDYPRKLKKALKSLQDTDRAIALPY